MNKLFGAKIAKLFKIFPIVDNLARKKCFFSLVLTFIKIGNVQFWRVADELNTEAKSTSNLRRIQRFFSEVNFNYEALAQALLSFLPPFKLRLCLDRTEWDFGQMQINILVLTAYFRGVGLPLYFEFLDNRSGNSSVEDRGDLLEKVLGLVGKDRIEYVVADREFIGTKFYNYLLVNKLNFYLRLRKNQYFEVNGQKLRAENVLAHRTQAYLDSVKIDEFYLSMALSRTKNKKGEDEFLIVLTNTFAHQALFAYRHRWSIEVFFQALKTRGFHLESTHLQDLKKLKMLFGLLSLSFAFCLSVGVDFHEKVQKIPLKKHGYKSHSFFRKGLNILREIFRKNTEIILYEIHKWFWKWIRMIKFQFVHYQ